MRKAVLAEILLAMVMPRERAAATAGDLIEGAGGDLRFAVALARTILGVLSGQISAELAAKAVTAAILLMIAARLIFMAAMTYGGRMVSVPVWAGPALGIAFLLLMPLLVGHLIARWLRGRELAAWGAIALFVAVCSLWWSLTPEPVRDVHTIRFFAAHLLVVTPVSLLPMLVGVILARRKSFRSGSAQ